MMTQGVTYVADIGQDIDDLIAVVALRRMGLLSCVVLDPSPDDDDGRRRAERLLSESFPVANTIPNGTTDVFVGGALTEVARFLADGHRIRNLVMNAGFAGSNVVPKEKALRKFRNATTARTYNFDLDAEATDAVLSSDSIDHAMLVGKNVCHSPLNTTAGIWRDSMGFLGEFDLSPKKRLHDLLAVCEGLVALGISDAPPSCEYRMLHPFHDGLHGKMTRWGSSEEPTGYMKARVAVGWASEAPRRDLMRLMSETV